MPEEDVNERSGIVWLDYKGVSALFTADAPFSVEEKLMQESQVGAFSPINVDLTSTEILKVAHHGSKNSTSESFLSYLSKVETAVISCGKDNDYGHPADELLQRLSRYSVDVYRTDTQGHIIVTISADGTYKIDCV